MAIDEAPKDSNLNSSEIQTEIKQSKRGGYRPGAGRKKKSKPEPLTKERRIEILESKISDPNISPRDLKSLSRELSLLKGESMPYDRRPVAERKPIEPPPEPDALPRWWSEKWARYYVWCRVFSDSSSPSHWTCELDRCEAEWAASEGLTVEELREQIRREYSEHMAQYFPNGYPRSTAEWAEWNRQHPDQYEESQRQGSWPLEFQWLVNLQEIPGEHAKRARYQTTTSEYNDGALFCCRISNRLGQIVSYPARLTMKK